MAKRKPRTTLPGSIPTRPDGTLNTPPEGPHADIFTDLEIGNAAAAAEREKRKLERAEETLHELTKATIRNSQPASVATVPATGKMRWPGTAYELARKVRDELAQCGQDITKRGVFTTGLEKACAEYENSKGEPFTAKVLRESLRQWELKNIR